MVLSVSGSALRTTENSLSIGFTPLHFTAPLPRTAVLGGYRPRGLCRFASALSFSAWVYSTRFPGLRLHFLCKVSVIFSHFTRILCYFFTFRRRGGRGLPGGAQPGCQPRRSREQCLPVAPGRSLSAAEDLPKCPWSIRAIRIRFRPDPGCSFIQCSMLVMIAFFHSLFLLSMGRHVWAYSALLAFGTRCPRDGAFLTAALAAVPAKAAA